MAPGRTLAGSAAKGALFMLIAQAARIVLQLASVVVLSRLLSPHDYGLIAIVLVVIGVGEIFRDFGLTSASVQAPELSRGQRDNLFWINTGIGVTLGLLAFALAWPLQLISGESELLGILQVLSSVFLINGLTTQYRAQLMRGLRFRAMAIIDVVSAASALGIAVILAFAGAGYWALVVQQLANAAIALIATVAVGRWLPRWYSRAYPIGSFVRFGWNLVVANLLSYGANQIDTVLVAARFGTAPLGLYNRAYQLVMTPLGQVRTPLSSVAIPVLSRAQNDPVRYESFVVSGQLMLGYTLGLPLLMVAGLSEPIVQIMLGPQWASAAPILRFFAIAALLTTLPFVGYWVYVSRGLSRQLMWWTWVSTGIRAVCIVSGSFFGILGVAAGVALAPAIAWPLSLWWLSRITTLPVRRLYGGAIRIVCVVATAGLASWATSQLFIFNSWLAVAMGAVAGIAAAALFLSLRIYRVDLALLVRFARLMLKREKELV
ncbi:lipopolysaccharide biosynthesis protein [Microbacterium sp. 1P10UB]|uniref:lipopolysaccharide biosynthesis protein n=1 Tax=unclassified Microbacterium TaxID=2609290 RepID=UPI0039A05006